MKNKVHKHCICCELHIEVIKKNKTRSKLYSTILYTREKPIVFQVSTESILKVQRFVLKYLVN